MFRTIVSDNAVAHRNGKAIRPVIYPVAGVSKPIFNAEFELKIVAGIAAAFIVVLSLVHIFSSIDGINLAAINTQVDSGGVVAEMIGLIAVPSTLT